MLKLLRHAAVVTFVAGMALLTMGLVAACGGGDGDDDEAVFQEFTPTATPTPSDDATNTPTPRPTRTSTVEPPTPTPTPFVGNVARLKIPRFNVDSIIENVGVDSANQMETPKDPYNTGWYDPRMTGWGGNEFFPGWNGNSVYSAHVDYFPNIKGPFNQLAQIEESDQVVVVMENGEEYVYEVISKQRYLANSMPMGDIIWAPDRPENEEWITLITCGGEFRATSASGAGEYLHRDVVVAKRVFPAETATGTS